MGRSSQKITDLRDLREAVLALPSSELVNFRRENSYQPVIGEGDPDARLILIGEAPGKNEALSGRPFCGASGKILDQILAEVGLARSAIYITSIVKDRPPANRDPRPEEIATYAPFLDQQLLIIQPTVIGTLGRFSMQYILSRLGLAEQIGPISSLHGRVFESELPYGAVKVMPLYHPAATIYNQGLRGALLEDFKKLKRLVD